MTTLRQAAMQALEALDKLSKLGNGNQDGNSLGNTIAQEAREHLFTALAQPEQEPCIGKDPRCPCQDGDACHYKDCGDTKALPVPVAQPEPTQWRDMVVASLVRMGINKHKARELADHFAEQPKQEPVAYYHPRSGFYWAKPTSIFAPTSVDVEPMPLYTAAERNNG